MWLTNKKNLNEVENIDPKLIILSDILKPNIFGCHNVERMPKLGHAYLTLKDVTLIPVFSYTISNFLYLIFSQ